MIDRTTIEAQAATFFEWPGDDKKSVTTFSAILFAEHIAKLTADHCAAICECEAARVDAVASATDSEDNLWLNGRITSATKCAGLIRGATCQHTTT